MEGLDRKWIRRIKRRARPCIAALLFYSGLLGLAVSVLGRMRNDFPAVVLFYHRFKEGKARTIPGRMRIDAFRRQLKHLGRWYDVISLDELIERIAARRRFGRPTVVITIDDGFRDNYDLAFPALAGMDFPATIFLTSGFIGTEKVPWVDEIGMAVRRTGRRRLALPELLGERTLDLSTLEKKARASHALYKALLEVEDEERRRYVARLLETLREETDGAGERERFMLSWEEIRDMNERGISFGAHTVSHPILSRMRLADAEREILDSKETIEERLGREVRHFAVPNGRDADFSDALRAFCKESGFRSVATTNSGRVEPGVDPYRLPRICPPESVSLFAFDLARQMFLG